MPVTESRYGFSSPVTTSVPSPHHLRLTLPSANLRLTRSSARQPLRMLPY